MKVPQVIDLVMLKDFYKVGHIDQYPKGTNLIFSNFTPRKSKLFGVDHSVFFGLKYFLRTYLEHSHLNVKNINDFIYNHFIKMSLGIDKHHSHVRALKELGYLPIAIYSVSEKTVVPCGVPALVIYNTHPDFFWVPGMLETFMSNILWGACTSATIAREYRLILDSYAEQTSDTPDFVDYQAHDFSFRGMFGLEAACLCGMAHLQYFKGTDTIPAVLFNYAIYGSEIGISSVPATEHSVMSAGGKENEFETYDRLITEVYPSGIVSIVSDTWDLWNVVDNFLPRLKDKIMARDGKVVIRPDSGDPEEILCGKYFKQFEKMEDAIDWAKEQMENQADQDCEGSYNCGEEVYKRQFKVDDRYYQINMEFMYGRHDKKYYFVDEDYSEVSEPEEIEIKNSDKGLIQLLWDIFGGTINSKGYKQLDPHIGAIYGDSITLRRCEDICKRLKENGFSSTNIVFGVGSYTYQYNTRDTLGWAMKATYAEINGEGRAITKDPITDDGTKKSHSGLLKVVKKDGVLQCLQNVTWEEFHAEDNELKLVYKDGVSY